MNTAHSKLKEAIIKKGKLLTKDEAFDIYAEHGMRVTRACYWTWDSKENKSKHRTEDYKMWELRDKAQNWYRMAVGSLVLKGHIAINI